jgi:antitoxin VapB
MCIDDQHITIRPRVLPIQIANAVVVAKIERLAAATGLTKTAAVEKAVDAMLNGSPDISGDDVDARVSTILAQIDRIPDRSDALDPLEWDANGLPR